MFAQQIRSELIKIRSARVLWMLPLVLGLAVPGLALFVGLTSSLQPDDTIVGGSLTGATLGLAVAGAWGALVVTSEYAAGTLAPTLAATPRRTRVLLAKAVVVAAATAVVALIAAAVSIGIGFALLDESTYAAGRPLPALFGIAVCFAAVGLLGLGIGVLLRSSAGAVAAVVAVLVLPALLGPLFGDLQRWVVGAAPATVVLKLAQSSDAGSYLAGSLGGWPSLLVVLAYSMVTMLLSRGVFDRRDV